MQELATESATAAAKSRALLEQGEFAGWDIGEGR
jgi:hypothetical protein